MSMFSTMLLMGINIKHRRFFDHDTGYFKRRLRSLLFLFIACKGKSMFMCFKEENSIR